MTLVFFSCISHDLVRPIVLNINSFNSSKGFGGLLSLIVMPITTLIIAIFITKKINNDTQIKNAQMSNLFRIDDSSGWRKQVFEIASTYKVDEETVCKLRACIGPLKETRYINEFDCDTKIEIEYFKRYIVLYCDDILNNEGVIISEAIRIMARFLLKEHWEFYINELHLPSKNVIKYKENMEKSIQQSKSELLKAGFKINNDNRICSYKAKKVEQTWL